MGAPTEGSRLPQMYLEKSDWSPRFECTFFTMKVNGFELRDKHPESVILSGTLSTGNSNFPAFYYRIELSCGSQKHVVLRRYSEFAHLYRCIATEVPLGSTAFPPGTCFCQRQENSFAENRAEQLHEFMHDCLMVPNLASEDEVVRFLELEVFAH